MFRGFNLDLNWDNKYDDQYYLAGINLFNSYENSVKQILKNYALSEGVLDGSKMQSNWFPQVNADIFISHSHKDEKRAIALSGWLFKTFGIKSFIDSAIWGYSNDLLKLIDEKFCYQSDSNTYDYNLRNYSTSHVHMMLSTALHMMIDKTECVFFLNTPNSISASSMINKTESPWIYFEIAITQMIRHKTPRRRLVKETRYFSKGGELKESLKIQYNIDLSHLAEINVDTFKTWKKDFTKTTANDALDRLYDLNPVNNNYLNG